MKVRFVAALLAASFTLTLSAATRMTYDINGEPTPIAWSQSSFPLRYEIDPRLAKLNANAPALVDRAFGAWAAVPEADIRFLSGGVVPQQSLSSLDRIVVSVTDDLFSGQGAVAVTSYTYDTSNGRMLDADIRVDPSLFRGDINVQMALQHEVGHILGLDHSAVLSSIMFPYVCPDSTPAALDSDDRIAIAAMYPKEDSGLTGATLQGRVQGDQGAIFAAQVVAVDERGQPVGTGLTNAAGEFSISGLPAGKYRVYAEPLDGPVQLGALQGIWRQAKEVSFPTEFLGTTVVVRNGEVHGNLNFSAMGPAQINARWVGVRRSGSPELNLSTAPVYVSPGERVTLAIGGDGFTSGMTEFEVLNPSIRRVSDFSWSSNFLQAEFEVDAKAEPTSSVVVVRSGRESAALTGAFRVYQPGRGRAVRK